MPTRHVPRLEYQTRLTQRLEAEARLIQRSKRVANARLAVFCLGVVLAWVAARGTAWLIPWLGLPALAFVTLVIVHARGAKGAVRAAKGVAVYKRGLANLDDVWAGTGDQGLRFTDDHHPYAEDLDLFGPGSIFERLSAAQTLAGQRRLASWLLGPADASTVRERQASVAELTHRLDLREDLAVLGLDVRESVDPARSAAWGEAPALAFPTWARFIAPLLAASALGTLAACLLGWGGWPFVVVAVLEMTFAYTLSVRVSRAIQGVERQAEHLATLSALLARIERETFESPGLIQLRQGLIVEGQTPSQRLAKLAKLVDLLEARRNQMFMPIGWLLLWTTQLSFALEAWRVKSGPSIALWLEAVGEFEALTSLAGYAFENPDDPFPEIVESGAVYQGDGLGHPLLPASKCVRNALKLGGDGDRRVLVVSGSNMSGKSTLLRTVGANAVLALSGGPVRATSLKLSPLAIGATLRVRDSLQEGHSRFYAELVRLRRLVDLARGPIPLLFLLDEVLAGTNSHDRRLGAEAVVRGLVDLGAIGLVTTHDLALAEVADRLGSKAENVHFADRFEDGVMSFDYTMRPGVVRHSNALALMRAVGLDVDTPASPG